MNKKPAKYWTYIETIKDLLIETHARYSIKGNLYRLGIAEQLMKEGAYLTENVICEVMIDKYGCMAVEPKNKRYRYEYGFLVELTNRLNISCEPAEYYDLKMIDDLNEYRVIRLQERRERG